MGYNFKEIERKWQKAWEKERIFEVKESKKKKKYYVLDMFPYPSGEGLHMGHAFVFSLGDIYARFKRMQGFNVLYPIGYDSLGLPAENAAIKAGTHPEDYTKSSIANFMKQQKAMGWSYDWSRIVKTSDPKFYKWDQWIFLQMLKRGIAYRKKAPVNWCSKCQTVLANEQVQNGKCWRHEDTEVEIKHLEQWFFRITDYADELLEGLEKIDWPQRAKRMQKNWIGKSHGTEIEFEIKNPNDKISNVVIVHGSPSNKEKAMDPKRRTYDKHWIPWIKEKLEEKEINCYTPLMPEPWEPLYNNWKKELEKLPISEESILVGHSSGGGFLVRWLGETGRRIKKLILVAPAIIHSGEWKPLNNLLKFKINKSIKNNVGEIIIFVSDDDSKGIKESVKIFSESFGVDPIKFKNHGHFTLRDMGTEEFPELLDKIVSRKKWQIFTTRPDTIFGVTFMVVSAQHPKLMELVTEEQKKEVEKFLKKIKSVSEKDKADLEKEGVFTGSYAINPLTKEKVPIYAGNFVLADYGSGMVMAVPAHDKRDFEFAKKYGIKIKEVIKGGGIEEGAYTGEGVLINSGEFNGLNSKEAKEKITKFLEKKKLGRRAVNYKLKDWLISRQRYWGTPIPVVYCGNCGIVPVSEKELPVVLPKKVSFGKGNPLETNEKWIQAKCPKCKGNAKRETDTMDTFVNSSWYYLRYCDPKNDRKIFDEKKANYWAPIDQYIGGPEHITAHLIYARFYTKFLRDIGLLEFDEPALKYFTQGIVKSYDGEKMSKSRGNVIEPLEMIEKYGADSLRFYLVSNSSPDKDFEWNPKGIQGSFRFVSRVYNYFENLKLGETDNKTESKLNKAIKEITEDVENFRHNLAVIKIRELFGYLSERDIDRKTAEKFLKLLHVYCPFVTEELWNKLGNKAFISLEKWPVADESKIDEELEKQEEAVEKLIEDINHIARLMKEKHGKEEKKAFVYVLPNEKKGFADNLDLIKKKTNLDIEIFAVSDKDKYDPENKSKKVKPGRPGIYLEGD